MKKGFIHLERNIWKFTESLQSGCFFREKWKIKGRLSSNREFLMISYDDWRLEIRGFFFIHVVCRLSTVNIPISLILDFSFFYF